MRKKVKSPLVLKPQRPLASKDGQPSPSASPAHFTKHQKAMLYTKRKAKPKKPANIQ